MRVARSPLLSRSAMMTLERCRGTTSWKPAMSPRLNHAPCQPRPNRTRCSVYDRHRGNLGHSRLDGRRFKRPLLFCEAYLRDDGPTLPVASGSCDGRRDQHHRSERVVNPSRRFPSHGQRSRHRRLLHNGGANLGTGPGLLIRIGGAYKRSALVASRQPSFSWVRNYLHREGTRNILRGAMCQGVCVTPTERL